MTLHRRSGCRHVFAPAQYPPKPIWPTVLRTAGGVPALPRKGRPSSPATLLRRVVHNHNNGKNCDGPGRGRPRRRSAAEPLEPRVLLSGSTLGPTDDAYVREGSPTTRSAPRTRSPLVVKNSPGGTARRSYLKFRSPPSRPGRPSSRRTCGCGAARPTPAPSSTWPGTRPRPNPNWPSPPLNWPTSRAGRRHPLDTETVNAVADRWYEWAVTPHVRTQRQAGVGRRHARAVRGEQHDGRRRVRQQGGRGRGNRRSWSSPPCSPRPG
jgi:hypothetical protein